MSTPARKHRHRRAELTGSVRSTADRSAPASTETDRRVTREGIREIRNIIAQSPMDPYRGLELRPGVDVQKDDELDDFVRRTGESGFHSCGTARMGIDPMAVVDPELKVIGLAGLRIADASVMPKIPSGNTNAATIMIGEKASDLILGRPPLPPSYGLPPHR